MRLRYAARTPLTIHPARQADRAHLSAVKASALQKKVALKALLEEQMCASAHRRIVAPMSEIERKLNKSLLVRVHACKAIVKAGQR